MKNILITGANGFIGKNLITTLRQNLPDINLLLFDVNNSPEDLREFARVSDFVFHLAGINRPQQIDEFKTGNVSLTEQLVEVLTETNRKVPMMISSTIQATLDNPYGQSKREAENVVLEYGLKTGASVFVYRFPNVFGKWCRPNYNSAVATFCYNVARDLPITVNDPAIIMNLVYIDDVVTELIDALTGNENRVGQFCEVPVTHTVTLGEIVNLIQSFKRSRTERSIPDMSNFFAKKLYSTYLSYLPTDQFSYPLKMNVDHRGSFTEFIKTPGRGQISVNISKPGIVKGNHWHHSKNEKFLVVSGRGVIRFRSIDTTEVIEYLVNGDQLEVVDIPTGYTHNIENLGDSDMVTIMWANENFDPAKPDTYFLEV